MAEFKFFCPQCGQRIQCDTGYVGTQINCPICQQAIVVPQVPGAGAPPPNPAAPAAGRQFSGAPVAPPPASMKPRAWQNLLVAAGVVLVLAGLGVGGWYGYLKFKRGHLPAGLVALWSAEGNALDSVSGQTATVVGGGSYAPGKVEQAFSFNGGNNIVIPDQPSLNPNNAITVECWAYARRYSPSFGQTLVSKDGVCAVGRQYLLLWGGGNNAPGGIRVHIGVPSGFKYFEGKTVLQTETWYHVAMTYDGVALKVYVDGKLDGEMAVTGPIITSSEPVRIGGGAEPGCSQFNFDGLIDEVGIYNRALSADEIRQRFNAGNSGAR